MEDRVLTCVIESDEFLRSGNFKLLSLDHRANFTCCSMEVDEIKDGPTGHFPLGDSTGQEPASRFSDFEEEKRQPDGSR